MIKSILYSDVYRPMVYSLEIKDGKLYGNGENASGQLGTGEITSKDSYEQEILIAENVIHVDAFAETMIYLNDKNELYGVGDNGSGQLGQPVCFGWRRLYHGEVHLEDFTVYAVNFQDKEYSWGKNATAFPKTSETFVSHTWTRIIFL